MTSSKLLLPLRVPELGPSLGKLVTGTGRVPAGLVLDGIRYRLVTRLMDHGGEARRLSANEARAPALAALGRDAWLGAWEETVAAVTQLLVTRVGRRLEAEARAVRMSRRLRRRVALGAGERRALAARLGSSGAILIPALDELEARASAAIGATALERHRITDWQDALRKAARKLEAAWLALEDGVEAEGRRWEDVADRIARWRKPLWPVAVTGLMALALALWLGLILGGFLAAPSWFPPL